MGFIFWLASDCAFSDYLPLKAHLLESAMLAIEQLMEAYEKAKYEPLEAKTGK